MTGWDPNDIVVLADADKVRLVLGRQRSVVLAQDVRLGTAKLHVDKLGNTVKVLTAVGLDHGRPQAVDLRRGQITVQDGPGRVQEMDQSTAAVVVIVVVIVVVVVAIVLHMVRLQREIGGGGAEDVAALVRVDEAAHVQIMAHAAAEAAGTALDEGLALDALAGGQGAEAVGDDEHVAALVQERLQVLHDDGHVLDVGGAAGVGPRGGQRGRHDGEALGTQRAQHGLVVLRSVEGIVG